MASQSSQLSKPSTQYSPLSMLPYCPWQFTQAKQVAVRSQLPTSPASSSLLQDAAKKKHTPRINFVKLLVVSFIIYKTVYFLTLTIAFTNSSAYTSKAFFTCSKYSDLLTSTTKGSISCFIPIDIPERNMLFCTLLGSCATKAGISCDALISSAL